MSTNPVLSTSLPNITNAPTRAFLTGWEIPNADAMQGWIAYVLESSSSFQLSLTSGLPIDGVSVLATSLGGASRWVELNFGGGTNTVDQQVPFSFATVFPLVLAVLAAGDLIVSANVIITSTFTAGTTFRVGTTATPTAMLGPTEINAQQVNQFSSANAFPVPGVTQFLLDKVAGVPLTGNGILAFSILKG